jgi:ribosomal protein L16 Arg81 hydroxylase
MFGNLSQDDFVGQHWVTRRPAVLRNVLTPAERMCGSWSVVRSTLRSEIKTDLYYHNVKGTHRSKRIRLSNTSLLNSVLDLHSKDEQPVIAYLFNYENFNEELKSVNNRFRFGYDFRYYSSLLSLATARSVIPAHIDYIDSLVIQLDGSRKWKVWNNTDISIEKLILLNDVDAHQDPAMFAVPATREVELHAGDVLYLPALFGHEGLSECELSVSYSVGWTAYSPYRIVSSIDKNLNSEILNSAVGSDRDYFLPVKEYSGCIDHAAYYSDYVKRILKRHDFIVPDSLLKRIPELDFSKLFVLP